MNKFGNLQDFFAFLDNQAASTSAQTLNSFEFPESEWEVMDDFKKPDLDAAKTDTTYMMDLLNISEADLKEEDLNDLLYDFEDPQASNEDSSDVDSLAFPTQFPMNEILSSQRNKCGFKDDLADLSFSQIERSVCTEDEDLIIPSAETTTPLVGFQTANGKVLSKPSESALKRARDLFSCDDGESECSDENRMPQDLNLNSNLAPTFSTGRGKTLPPPSEAAIKRAKALFTDAANGNVVKDEHEVIDSNLAISHSSFPIFSTGKGTVLPPPSEAALKRAKALFAETAEVAEGGSAVEDYERVAEESTVASMTAFPMFSTGKGKTLPPPSESALKRAQTLVNEIEISSEPQIPISTLPMFSTGKGKTLPPPTEDAIRQAKKLMASAELKPLNLSKDQPDRFKSSHTSKTASTATACPFKKPIPMSSAWKQPRPKPVAKTKSSATPIISLFDLSCGSDLKRFNLRDFFKSAPEISKYALCDYEQLGINEAILRMTSVDAKRFRISNWGPSEARSELLELKARESLVTIEWMENHYRWIVWKFAAQIRSFPFEYSVDNLSPAWILQQLAYRYERELNQGHRSALKKIIERDDAAGKYVCLLVAQIDFQNRRLELSDGWYSLWTTQLDAVLWDLVERRKLVQGMKIEICGASLAGDEAIPALEASSPMCACSMKISRNSVRRSPWDSRLGFVPKTCFLSTLSWIHPRGGGPIPALRLLIDRVYPSYFKDLGTGVVRSEREHFKALEQAREAERAEPMEEQNLVTDQFTLQRKIRVVANEAKCSRGLRFAVITLKRGLGDSESALLKEGQAILAFGLMASGSSGTRPGPIALAREDSKVFLYSTNTTRIIKDVPLAAHLGVRRSISLEEFAKLATVNEKGRGAGGGFGDEYDVTGVYLGRSTRSGWIWLTGRDRDEHGGEHGSTARSSAASVPILVCLKVSAALEFPFGSTLSFRDICFRNFDSRLQVAHFSFNAEYSEVKRVGNAAAAMLEYQLGVQRFQALTE